MCGRCGYCDRCKRAAYMRAGVLSLGRRVSQLTPRQRELIAARLEQRALEIRQ